MVNCRDIVLQKCCYNILNLLQDLFDSKCQHSKKDMGKTFIHFPTKKYLGGCCTTMWYMLAHLRILSLNAQVFIAILRRLAMRDLVDPYWNLCGSWSEVLTHLDHKIFANSGSGPIVRSRIDEELDKLSLARKRARNSINCHGMYSNRVAMGHDMSWLGRDEFAPQRFEYFPKCSAPGCVNIETKERPHSLRCTKCHYFHYCCAPCQTFCEERTNVHERYCTSVSPQKAECTKQQMEAFLCASQKSGGKKGEYHQCNTCRMPASNCDKELMGCSQCKSVAYCSHFCQKFDWQNGHKEQCKPKEK